jgi:hypothetical protein
LESSLSLPPSLVPSKHPALFAACPFQFLVCYSIFFCRVGVSLSWGLCWFIPGVAVGIWWATYLLTCWSASPKQVWMGIWQHGIPGFSVLCECSTFVWVGGLGCQSFASSWWFFSGKCGSSFSGRVLFYGAHSVCFLPLVTILDPLMFIFLTSFFYTPLPHYICFPLAWPVFIILLYLY